MIKYSGKTYSRDDFCVVIIDDTHKYSGITKEYVKNIADYTILNCISMNIDVYITRDEESTLQHVDYEKAVVISAGTEFLYGDDFFKYIQGDYFLLGHILDMGDAYYTLHEQCYVVDLVQLQYLETAIGQTEHCEPHVQIEPNRSKENIHDHYTPKWIVQGENEKAYKHKLHGWNVISYAMDNDLIVEVFNDNQRKSKNYIYPDGTGVDYLHKRYHYALTELVYTENTGSDLLPVPEYPLEQLILPASGNLWSKLANNNTTVKFYDHSLLAIEHIKQQTSHLKNAEYHVIDAVANVESLIDIIDEVPNTYIEMSNVFCFECTAAFYSTEYRKQKEHKLISHADSIGATIHFDQRAGDLKQLPYWHY
jgi:hypothetical protein